MFFDTTMRDGRQCPGAWVTDAHYFEYIALANRVGFDVIEAGFPSSSESEFWQVKEVADRAWSGEISSMIAGLCQLRRDQVERTIRSLEWAVKARKAFFHTYLPVDPKLLRASIGDIDRAAEIQKVSDFISLAVWQGMIAQFSPEGYSRVWENFDFTTDLIRSAVQAWATYINCPDTIGGASHYEGQNYYVENMRRHKEIIDREFPWNGVVWSVHTHNDLGNAVENSIWWVVNGVARKVEWTVAWVWERAGNADLLQVVMNLRQFHDKRFDTNHIDTSLFWSIGNLVSRSMLPVQPHYPIIGANAYRHTSGGHVNALQHDSSVYHPFDPVSVGGNVSFIFGPQSGWNLAQEIVEKSGIKFEGNEKVFAQYLKNAFPERRKGMTDGEIINAYHQWKLQK